MTYTKHLDSPVGLLRLVATDNGLSEVQFEQDGEIDRHHDDHQLLAEAETQLLEYFAGQRQEFDIEIDIAQGTEFQLAAWQALAEVPYGETRTYRQQAQAVGRPKAVRAIGSANGKNPISIILPCHRIIGSDGSLTGYGGGLSTKEFLLNHEQAHLNRM